MRICVKAFFIMGVDLYYFSCEMLLGVEFQNFTANYFGRFCDDEYSHLLVLRQYPKLGVPLQANF